MSTLRSIPGLAVSIGDYVRYRLASDLRRELVPDRTEAIAMAVSLAVVTAVLMIIVATEGV
jgi:hypothetical protein